MRSRGSSANLWNRVCDLVVTTDMVAGFNRVEYARRWKCTTRNVSHVIVHARNTYGVRVKFIGGGARKPGYTLVDRGVLDVPAIRKRQRKDKVR